MSINSKADQSGNRSSDQEKHLAQSIWFVRLSRQLRLPLKVQHCILKTVGGSRFLWQYDFKQIRKSLLDNTRTFGQGQSEVRYRKFLLNSLNLLEQAWQDLKLRDSSLNNIGKYLSQKIGSVDITEKSFPANLCRISGCPGILFLRGYGLPKLNRADQKVTVIGTRRPTPYGIKVTQLICEKLSDYDIAVISGLAIGIDAAAHKTVLLSNGYTAAIVAGGPDHIYPRQNLDLYEQIVDKGVLISEHPPGTKPLKQYFPARNRLLSGIADYLIVTESPAHSGTLVTAGFAADQNREVYAVPGNILQHSSDGCNQLIKDGAGLLDDINELLTDKRAKRLSPGNTDFSYQSKFTQDNSDLFKNYSEQSPQLTAPDDLGIIRLIRLCLQQQSMDAGTIAEKLNQPLSKVSAMLTIMELNRDIIFSKGRYFLT